MQNITNTLFVTIISVIIASCNSNIVFNTYKTLPNRWHKDSIININFKAPDTIKPYNLFINLRNNKNYPYNNLYLIIELNYPNGKVITDTLEYKMAAANGELLGEGSYINENKLWYRGYNKTFIFSELGNYSAYIGHAMREQGEIKGLTNLEGITKVGMSIEAVNRK